MGPFEDAIPWSNDGMLGVERFLNRVWNMSSKIEDIEANDDVLKILNKTIKKVTNDIENMRFNTAVSALMIMSNNIEKLDTIPKIVFEKFVLLLSVFAPFMSEELWHMLGNEKLIENTEWPKCDTKYLEDNDVVLAVQINGKTRGTISIKKGLDESGVMEIVYSDEKLSKYISDGSKIKKTIFVKDRIINFLLA